MMKKIDRPAIILYVHHGRHGVVVGLQRDLAHPFPLDHGEAVEVGEEGIPGADLLGGEPHGQLGVVHAADVDVVLDVEAGAVLAWKIVRGFRDAT